MRQATKLRQAGFSGRLRLDPAAYEDPTGASTSSPTLWDFWHQQQVEIGVVEFISPGSYVPKRSLKSLRIAIRAESSWVRKHGGRVSLALDSSWLTTGLADLIRELKAVELPLAVAFSHRYDPLGSAAAVRGLITLLGEVPDVAILRCDIGAIGAIAHGAALGAIGTSSTVRHAFPPDQRGGGGGGGPAVFVPSLLDYRQGAFLAQLPRGTCPRCPYECCDNQEVGRFYAQFRADEAMRHNRISISRITEEVLRRAPADRPAHFTLMCQSAVRTAAHLSAQAKRPFDTRPQVEAWADVI